MKIDVMIERKYLILSIWNLLHQKRAIVRFFAKNSEFGKCCGSKTIHDLSADLHEPLLKRMSTSRKTLVFPMMLPIPLVGVISSYLPAPWLWERRLEMLSRGIYIDATLVCHVRWI